MASISAADKKKYLDCAFKAADWFVNSQLGEHRPDWNADRGRFLYYYYIPDKKHVPGINWTLGRGIFVTTEAYKLSGDKRYLDSAKLAANQLASMQSMDSRFPLVHGMIREHTPVDYRGGTLDGAQAASGFLMLEKVTGDPEYLRRGQAFCDYLLRTFSPIQGFTGWACIKDGVESVDYAKTGSSACIAQAIAIPLWHMYCRTGDERYLTPVLWAADRILECQQPDGSFYTYPELTKDMKPQPRFNQHDGIGKGNARFQLWNDDAMMVVVIAAYRAAKIKRHLDAMVRYAKWIMKTAPSVRPYCAFPIQANNILDIGKEAGQDWSGWVLKHLKKHLLDLQVQGTGDKAADGGFRGEDEEGNAGIFGGTGLDYVTTRTTCYAAGTLFRLSGKGTGAGFSANGL
ncbi:MAG: beta-L-arabinofuranosidase domain-containing protein [Fibrobacterota bacterium]